MPPKSTFAKTVSKVVAKIASPLDTIPKRVPTAYQTFMKSYFEDAKASTDKALSTAQGGFKAAAATWKGMAEAEKATFNRVSNQEREVYAKARATWEDEARTWASKLSPEELKAFKKDQSLKALRKYAPVRTSTNKWWEFLSEYRAKNKDDPKYQQIAGKWVANTQLTKDAAEAYRKQKGI